MRVGVHRHANGGVTQQFLYYFRVLPCLHKQRGRRMSETMKGHMGETRTGHYLLEIMGNDIGI